MIKKLNDEKDKELSLKYHDNFNIVMLSFIIIFCFNKFNSKN